MEISLANIQVKPQSTNETSQKPSNSKQSDSSFSKVYNDVSSKNTDQASPGSKETESNTDSHENAGLKTTNESLNTKEATKNANEKTNDSTKLENLIEMLILSGNVDPKLLDMIKSSGSTDANDLKDLIAKMLKEKLSDGLSNISDLLSASANGQQLSQNLKNSNFTLSTDKLNARIDKLASKISDKLLTDNDFKSSIITKLLNQPQETSADDTNSLKEAILDKLKSMLNDKSPKQVMNFKDFTNLARESIISKTDKTDVEDNTITEKIADSKSSTSDFKFNTSSSNKEDSLLKQLTDKESSKNTNDKVSDKIANVINRFEVINTSKPAIAEGKPVISKATFNEDFIKAVKFMDMNNLKELSVKVLPKDLGEIVIRLSMDNGVMKANITAANKDTYNLLNSQLPTISNQLSEQNMAIQSFSLSLSNGDNFLFSGEGNKGQGGNQQGNSNSKIEGIDDLEVQGETLTENNSSLNTLA